MHGLAPRGCTGSGLPSAVAKPDIALRTDESPARGRHAARDAGRASCDDWEQRYWREAGQARLIKLDLAECLFMIPMNAASFFAVSNPIFRVLRLGSLASFAFQLYAFRCHRARYRRCRAAITLAMRTLRNLLAVLWHVGPLARVQRTGSPCRATTACRRHRLPPPLIAARPPLLPSQVYLAQRPQLYAQLSSEMFPQAQQDARQLARRMFLTSGGPPLLLQCLGQQQPFAVQLAVQASAVLMTMLGSLGTNVRQLTAGDELAEPLARLQHAVVRWLFLGRLAAAGDDPGSSGPAALPAWQVVRLQLWVMMLGVVPPLYLAALLELGDKAAWLAQQPLRGWALTGQGRAIRAVTALRALPLAARLLVHAAALHLLLALSFLACGAASAPLGALTM
jgi:hypothetical protein